LIRRAAEHKNHDSDPDAMEKVAGNEISAELRFECAGSLERMRLLPPQLSRPWMLKYLDGKSLPIIAELCHCSPSTVQRRIRSAERQIAGSTRELT
jgi:DNA-directed RNA polymerase specialized sigma24 family protein